MGGPIRLASEKLLIIPWNQTGFPWSSVVANSVFNILSLSSLVLMSRAGLVLDGKSVQSLSEVISMQPLFAFLLLFPVLGGWHFYRLMVFWINRSRLEWTEHELILSHGPIPWPVSPRRYSTNEIVSITIDTYSPGYENGSPIKRLRLLLKLKGKAEVVLVEELLPKDVTILEEWIVAGNLHQTALEYRDAA